MKLIGFNMGRVKQENQALVLKYITREGAVSRKDISDATGLTAASVTQIVNGFIDEGILRELGTMEENTGVGRKRVLVDLNYDYAFLWSISIEIEQTTVALTNLRGAVLDLVTLESAAGTNPRAYLLKVAAVCRKLEEKQMRSVLSGIRAISVGIPGIVDREKGTSIHAYGIWDEEVAVCKILSEALKVKCIIENNVNAFALATLYFGEGRRYDHLHVIKWGPGVGSTLIINGRIYEGSKGKAAELGHFIVEKDGRKCNCGRYGCLETKVSYYALNQLMNFERDSFADAYEQTEGQLKAELDDAIDLFARSIVNSMTIMAPNRVILTGFMVKDQRIRERLIQACRHYDPGILKEHISYSMLADRAAYIGPVAAFIRNEVFTEI